MVNRASKLVGTTNFDLIEETIRQNAEGLAPGGRFTRVDQHCPGCCQITWYLPRGYRETTVTINTEGGASRTKLTLRVDAPNGDSLTRLLDRLTQGLPLAEAPKSLFEQL